ncbi:hypothetical protein CY35_19G080700 [Sphagnum magellanicum]|nr:hypothetical protein CY35_19G080700 [Sphagnum magellanicum]
MVQAQPLCLILVSYMEILFSILPEREILLLMLLLSLLMIFFHLQIQMRKLQQNWHLRLPLLHLIVQALEKQLRIMVSRET